MIILAKCDTYNGVQFGLQLRHVEFLLLGPLKQTAQQVFPLLQQQQQQQQQPVSDNRQENNFLLGRSINLGKFSCESYLHLNRHFCIIEQHLLGQWFSTFFGSRHTKHRKKFGGTLISRFF